MPERDRIVGVADRNHKGSEPNLHCAPFKGSSGLSFIAVGKRKKIDFFGLHKAGSTRLVVQREMKLSCSSYRYNCAGESKD